MVKKQPKARQTKRKLPPGMSEEDVVLPDPKAKPTVWVKVTEEELKAAEKAKKLYAFDPKTMSALIRD